MSFTVLVHVSGEEAVLGEIERSCPHPKITSSQSVTRRRRDEKDLPYLHETVTSVVWPMWRINFIEILPTREDEDLIGFVRE